MTPSEYSKLDAVGLAALIRAGEVTASEVIQTAYRVIRSLDPVLNAIVFERDESEALEEAKHAQGPFAGVPLLIKDLGIRQAGLSVTSGILALSTDRIPETQDNGLGRRFRELGFVTIGVTATPELGLQSSTQPLASGAVCNPHNPKHTPGGSSGGSAAAVAAGYVPFAHANDGGGSTRLPASWTGTLGLKTSRGRVLLDDRAFEYNVCDFGIGRSVRDLGSILNGLATDRPGFQIAAHRADFAEAAQIDPSSLSIGVVTDKAGIVVDPEHVAAVEKAATTLEALGHRCQHEDFDNFDLAPVAVHAMGVTGAGARRALRAAEGRLGRPILEGDVEPYMWALLAMMVAEDARSLGHHWRSLQSWSRRVFSNWTSDLLMTPTTYEPAPTNTSLKVRDDNMAEVAAKTGLHCSFLYPFNLLGSPAISLPLGRTTKGLPIGVQLVARPGREDLLLNVAGQLERFGAYDTMIPPHHASNI